MKYRLKSVINKIISQYPEIYYHFNLMPYYDKYHIKNDVYDLDHFELEDIYRTSSGREIPIYKKYRYWVKPGWQYYGPFAALNQLQKLKLLDAKDESFLKWAVGYRTLMVSMDEGRDVLMPYINKYPELFLSRTIQDLNKRPLKPTKKETENRIQQLLKSRKHFLRTAGIHSNTVKNSSPLKILEIGYTTGGESAIAFERMGFEVHAIDYFFNESVEQTPRHEYIKELMGSGINFHLGDITKETPFDDESFDVIFSLSVIEHILDLDKAFKEMFRILKKDGVIVHNYGGFSMPGGAHSLGLMDSPWAHIRLSEDEYYDYLRKMRPFEAEIAINWIKNALKPKDTISTVQRSVVEAGFSIEHWSNDRAKDHYHLLNKDILNDVFKIVPGLTLEDLLSIGITFVGKKV